MLASEKELHSENFADPIDTMRFLAIFFMMYAHYRLSGADTAGSLFGTGAATLYDLFYGGLSRASAPFLGVVSGYFVCRALEHRSYLQLVKTRFSTLLVPTMLWSACFIALDFLRRSAEGQVDHFHQLYIADLWRLFNYVIPITAPPANFPLHYLADLFKLCLIAPIAVYLLSHLARRQAIALVILVAMMQVTPSPANLNNILPRWDLLTFFLAGIAARQHSQGLKSLMMTPISPAMLAASALTLALGAAAWEPLLSSDDRIEQYAGYLLIMCIKCAGIVIFIRAVQEIVRNPRLSRWVPERGLVFTAFCTHIFFVFILQKLVATQSAEPWHEPLKYFTFFAFPAVVFGTIWAGRKVQASIRPDSNPA